MMETKIIKNGIIITADKHNRIIKNGSIAVEGNNIIDVGESDDIEKRYDAQVFIDANAKMVIPGFINTHMHTNIIRGDPLTYAPPEMPWHDVFDEVRSKTGIEDCKNAALMTYSEGVRSGITTYVDFTRAPEGSGKAAEQIGVRTAVVPMIYDEKEPWSETLQNSIKLIKQNAKISDSRIRYWLGFDDYTTSSPETIDKIVEAARKLNVNIHTHSNEICYLEPTWCMQHLGMYGIEYLNEHQCVGPDVLIAHCIQVHWKEINILQKTGTRVAHCSTTNLRSGNGEAPIPEYISRGIPVGLATDNTMGTPVNMFLAMRCALFMQRSRRRHPWALTPEEVFRMATIGGAKAMAMDKQIGSIEKGKKADLVLINLKSSHFTPSIIGDKTNLIQQLVNMGDTRDVDTVIINGKTVLENKEFKTIDEEKMLENASQTAFNLINRSSLKKYNPIF
jgi:5-methylthioadenosine/S-adenosylhomocysteine deaminase